MVHPLAGWGDDVVIRLSRSNVGLSSTAAISTMCGWPSGFSAGWDQSGNRPVVSKTSPYAGEVDLPVEVYSVVCHRFGSPLARSTFSNGPGNLIGLIELTQQSSKPRVIAITKISAMAGGIGTHNAMPTRCR